MNILTRLKQLQEELNVRGPLAGAEVVRQAHELITCVHNKLDGKEWDSDTALSISEILDNFGLDCRNPDDCDCDDRSWHGDVHDSACPLAGLNREVE
jgi:hypothetical protein